MQLNRLSLVVVAEVHQRLADVSIRAGC